MKRLQSVLSRYTSDSLILGPAPEFNVEGLTTELEKVSKKDQRSVWARLIIIAIIFFGLIWAVWHWHNDPQTISLVLAGSGVTISWLLKEVLGLWEEKAASELVLVLVVDLDTNHTKPIIKILSKKTTP